MTACEHNSEVTSDSSCAVCTAALLQVQVKRLRAALGNLCDHAKLDDDGRWLVNQGDFEWAVMALSRGGEMSPECNCPALRASRDHWDGCPVLTATLREQLQAAQARIAELERLGDAMAEAIEESTDVAEAKDWRWLRANP